MLGGGRGLRMPNSFSYLALFSWPVVVFLLFRMLPQAQALVWSVLGGYLLLPFGVGINPPLLPTLDKAFIPVMAAAVMSYFSALDEAGSAYVSRSRSERPMTRQETRTAAASAPAEGRALGFTRQTERRAVRTSAQIQSTVANPAGILPMPRLILLLIGLALLTQFLTLYTNQQPLHVGPRTLQGLALYDSMSMILTAIVLVLPFWLAQRLLGSPNGQAILLRILCICGLIYSVPTLLEVRLSPQISKWVYGFLAQSFAQAKRDDGFRPVVFLQHGLWLAIFLVMVACAGFALWRHEKTTGRRSVYLLAGLWLSMVLLLCHSLGAVMVLMVAGPLILLLAPRWQILVAALVALVVITYPMLRGAGLVPVNSIYQAVASISVDRADSLMFRFDNEDQLLAHANEQPLAGWGGYGRARLHDPKTGLNISTTDGMWVLLMGETGWLGYVATFGLLCAPIFLLLWRRRSLQPDFATAGLCLILAANLIDMILNATMTPVTWMIAGALCGRCRYAAQAETESAASIAQQDQRPMFARPRPATRMSAGQNEKG